MEKAIGVETGDGRGGGDEEGAPEVEDDGVEGEGRLEEEGGGEGQQEALSQLDCLAMKLKNYEIFL